MGDMMLEKEFERPLEEVMTDFIIPNCVLQVTPDIISKGGVSIPLLLSKPGAGKTSIQYQKFKALNWGLLTLQPALKPQEEYGGIPKFKRIKDITNEETQEKILATEWSIPEVVVDLHKMSKIFDIVVFFWDDIHLCGPEHLALMQECFTERAIRGYKLPSNVAIVLAGNPSNKAGFRSLSSAIINRCARLPVYSRYEDWKKNFAISNDIHPSIISFLGHSMYTKYFHEDEQINDPWASPRQWTRLSNFITSYQEHMGQMMSRDSLLYLATGHVGKEAASQFCQYYEIFLKFDMEKVFEKIDNMSIPDDLYERYIFIFAAINHIFLKYNKKTQNELNSKIVVFANKMLMKDESLGILFLKEIALIENETKKKIKIQILDIINDLDKLNKGILEKVFNERSEND